MRSILAVASTLGLALALAGCSSDDSGTRPVITPTEEWNAYPTAIVSGPLELRDDCLLLREEVVFWPQGTGWDDASQAVTFDDHDPAPVGERFTGGGGTYDATTDFSEWLGDETGGAIRDCVERTGANNVVFAYAGS